MGEKIVVGPVGKGLRNDVTPFNIDNDSFPVLLNAYQWRGRVKRKRGTSLLGRLTRFFNSNSASYSASVSFNLVAGEGNLLTGFSLEADGNIIPGSVSILVAGNTYTDDSLGTLTGAPGGTGTINYATGAITISGGAGSAVSGTFRYTPDLPVMGLEDLILETQQYPGTLAFDTVYSYNIRTASPHDIYDVSFYKNPPVNAVTMPGYTQKAVVTPTSWNGQDYQQFWTVNYEGALWATNGIPIPFDSTKVGMQFKAITNVIIGAAGPPALANLTIAGHGLVVGDFVFINEVQGITGINFQTGYVTVVVDPNTVTVEFPFATLGGAYTSVGIAQYLTSRADTTIDGIRWYDGDPTDGNATSPTLNGNKGWVNFAPPLSKSIFAIADLPAAQYYLVGARMILPFKDRLLFIGPVIQTSATNSAHYLQDTVIYSQNGTPYYTSSWTSTPTDKPELPTTVFEPILVPDNKTATATAYFEDITGFGGFVQANIDEPIITTCPNEDVLIMGFRTRQVRFVYTGNDIVPFEFFIINSELGSLGTFSATTFDKGVMSCGNRGFLIANQAEAVRIDNEIPDEVFEIALTENGQERITSQRDFVSEWLYFTYPSNTDPQNVEADYKFPNQTLQYNYRDNSWAVFKECYTTYGIFRKLTGYTWATIGSVFATWSVWNEPWNSGSTTLLQAQVIAGNQQGFVIFREDGTNEANSLYIQNISGSLVTSPNHQLNEGDYIVISGVLGTVGTEVNGKIFSVAPPITTDAFTLNPTIGAGTYIGSGLIQRMYVPLVQTKQFQPSWGMARKTRLGVQRYLLSTTNNAQITLLIYLSENADDPYNDGPIVPTPGSVNPALVYSTVLYTCPESTNLGLTPANSNLQMAIAGAGQQIWHRVNTSLIGDTIQLGFTMSDEQMRDSDFKSQFAEIEIHGFIIDATPSSELA